ncbi:30S ribosomal protein S20 [candidate division CPR3 bacterium GWF2_35_18]|uniref:Small ribosomal subunit protein bS20 n=1 Tax=candidate division CPR3 bacterium GW2011_GWF2_35_18 TaxID=1618350 RepID=A0A0G0BHM6_UNCC3|nr:MAG: 30S ribosomal protein S20 [candidate division CPR3 bacterium GW2011_GWF2_35_18]KKP86563.1 MAG: 30S ribosomal protein S20 [candidate division CPR3 bacterium GW2011_GWE2_35_7]OGB63218.1 MAG: 30S ribosomal protein S20 [candidate division CPR3 bacterium GWF2_35_18]OGB64132.1 MAG: 30S ribosomal protein S20 [candidate division CPR3 bacterium RIFOXYA2_FULL_35_13]OGB75788.1 MAG: 30S ribosomal protein S20 [candidate division CPR3 bacterium RIFOXYC2_FULL_35_7]OGB79319.1 MAG: 30S ribosomal protei
MPVTKTATRALRKSKNKETRNKIVRGKIKDVIRKLKKGIEGKSKIDLNESLKQAYKTLDKAAKERVIDKNKASRLKSRLSKKIAKISDSPKAEVKTKKAKTKKKKS